MNSKFEMDGTVSEEHVEEVNGETITVIDKFDLYAISMVPLENAMFPFRSIKEEEDDDD